MRLLGLGEQPFGDRLPLVKVSHRPSWSWSCPPGTRVTGPAAAAPVVIFAATQASSIEAPVFGVLEVPLVADVELAHQGLEHNLPSFRVTQFTRLSNSAPDAEWLRYLDVPRGRVLWREYAPARKNTAASETVCSRGGSVEGGVRVRGGGCGRRPNHDADRELG